MAYYDDVKTTRIAYIGFMSVMGTLIIIMLLQVLYFQTRVDQAATQQATAGPPTELADLTARQQTMLTRVEVVDRDKGVVTIGIRRAMDLVVSELDSGKAPKEVVGPLGPPIPAASGPNDTDAPTTGTPGQPAGEAGEQAATAKEEPAQTDSKDDGETDQSSQPPEKKDEHKS